ncbi:MAG: chemotaxis response regulator protein-glutamate methylesterase [Thiohalomonadaceae bacterium]
MTGRRTSVLVVDDSAVIRRVLTEVLSADPEIEVLGAASDPIFAMNHMQKRWPDVLILDVEMPRMDGISFLRQIMAERPTPVIICSSLTEQGAKTTMEAMGAGAVEIVTKPKLGVRDFLENEGAHLARLVKSAARIRPERLVSRGMMRPAPVAAPAAAMVETTDRVVAIGTSTGGTQSLEVVLSALPAVVPGIVVVQHMPERFTSAFARRLDSLCNIEVREARDHDRVIPGVAYIAPGGRHMIMRRSGAQYYVEVREGPVVNHHRPSVDVLFQSVAKAAGPNALGVIMTGMGDDGAEGIRQMHAAGARTLAQNEETCVVFGMPKEAIRRGGIDTVLPLDAIAPEIVRFGTGAARSGQG